MAEVSARKLLNEVARQLQKIYEPAEARTIVFLLLEHFFGLDKAAVLAGKMVRLTDAIPWNQAVERLLGNEPVQYVTGKTEFYNRIFAVNDTVLIPRPETEELVDWVIRENRQKPVTILDIGTGSGCIAVTLAKELPAATVWAIDISQAALQTAALNARRHAASVIFQQADILQWEKEPVFGGLHFDVVVSNPPYVAESEKKLMRPNVLSHEPHQALFVPDTDPLVFYRQIAWFCRSHLNAEGQVFFETNEHYANQTARLLETASFTTTEVRKDLFGKDRFIKSVL